MLTLKPFVEIRSDWSFRGHEFALQKFILAQANVNTSQRALY